MIHIQIEIVLVGENENAELLPIAQQWRKKIYDTGVDCRVKVSRNTPVDSPILDEVGTYVVVTS